MNAERLITAIERFVEELRTINADELAADHVIVTKNKSSGEKASVLVWASGGWSYSTGSALRFKKDHAEEALKYIVAPHEGDWHKPRALPAGVLNSQCAE